MHWGNPLGISKVKPYFLVYKVLTALIQGLLLSSLISIVLCWAVPGWAVLDVLHSNPLIVVYLFGTEVRRAGATQRALATRWLGRVIRIILLTENKYSILTGSKPQP